MTEKEGCSVHSSICQAKHESITDRIAGLEERIVLRFEATAQALKLAKELHDRDRLEFAHTLETKMESYNQWQNRFDKIEGTLVRKDDLDKEVRVAREHTDLLASTNAERLRAAEKVNADRWESQSRLIYIGMGLAIGLATVVPMVIQIIIHFSGPG